MICNSMGGDTVKYFLNVYYIFWFWPLRQMYGMFRFVNTPYSRVRIVYRWNSPGLIFKKVSNFCIISKEPFTFHRVRLRKEDKYTSSAYGYRVW